MALECRQGLRSSAWYGIRRPAFVVNFVVPFVAHKVVSIHG